LQGFEIIILFYDLPVDTDRSETVLDLPGGEDPH
jgi:hypothetical protein